MLDTTPLKTKGVQVVPGFFDPSVTRDFARMARDIVEARDSGRLTVDSQDAMGFPYSWYEPYLTHPDLVELMTTWVPMYAAAAGAS
jgi:hypothetical protein